MVESLCHLGHLFDSLFLQVLHHIFIYFCRFVDTAGIRKRGKVEYGPEFFMINRFVLIHCFLLLIMHVLASEPFLDVHCYTQFYFIYSLYISLHKINHRAFKAIRRAEVVVLMLDAVVGMVDQDRILAQVRGGHIKILSELLMVGSSVALSLGSCHLMYFLCFVTKTTFARIFILQRIADEGRACVIALNKWDAIEEKDDNTYLKGD